MFELEQAIAEWRREMRKAHVNDSARLEELEAHLRDEFHWQVESGNNEEAAFATAVQQLGSAYQLRDEFKKADRHSSWQPMPKEIWTKRFIAIVWFYCSCGGIYALVCNGGKFMADLRVPNDTRYKYFPLIALCAYFFLHGLGAWGCLSFFRDVKTNRRIVRLLAAFSFLNILFLLSPKTRSSTTFGWIIFGIFSFWYLRPRRIPKLATQ